MKNEILERRWLNSEYTVAEFLDRLAPDWLDDIGIGFCQLVRIGHNNFDLRDDDLVLFLRLSILALLKEGGVPARYFADENPGWDVYHGYGTDPDQIADAVIAEWLAAGSPLQVEWGDWWFSRPDRLP